MHYLCMKNALIGVLSNAYKLTASYPGTCLEAALDCDYSHTANEMTILLSLQVDKENVQSNQVAAAHRCSDTTSKGGPLSTQMDLAESFHVEHKLVAAVLTAARTAQVRALTSGLQCKVCLREGGHREGHKALVWRTLSSLM